MITVRLAAIAAAIPLVGALVLGHATPAVAACDNKLLGYEHPAIEIWEKYEGESDSMEVQTDRLATGMCVEAESPNRMYKVKLAPKPGSAMPPSQVRKLKSHAWWVGAASVETTESKTVTIDCDDSESDNAVVASRGASGDRKCPK